MIICLLIYDESELLGTSLLFSGFSLLIVVIFTTERSRIIWIESADFVCILLIFAKTCFYLCVGLSSRCFNEFFLGES